MVISKAKDGKPLAIKKIKSQLELFTGLDKLCYMKQGDIVNFVANLSELQLHLLNKLQSEDCRDIPVFTFYAEMILSLQ